MWYKIAAFVLVLMVLVALHRRKPLKITYYYMPTCPHCVGAAPKIKEFRERLRLLPQSVTFIEMDVSKQTVPDVDRVPVLEFQNEQYNVDSLDKLYNAVRSK